MRVELGYRGNMGKRMKRANKVNARAAVILGEDELAKSVAAVRDLDSGEQREVPLEALSAVALAPVSVTAPPRIAVRQPRHS